MSTQRPNGWYKLSSLNNVQVCEFIGGLTGSGYSFDDYEKAGCKVEPVVVLTQAEFDKAIEDARQRGKSEMLEAVESYHEENY